MTRTAQRDQSDTRYSIKFEDLSFSYRKDSEVLHQLNLQVKAGEYLVILGQNGSGKSSLARHCNALLSPSSGKAYIYGFDSAYEEHFRDIRRRVGMVFQHPDDQMVSSVVRDDIAFGPENLCVETLEIHERVELALKTVGMQAFAELDPSELSGGQKQRIAIAGILAMQPELIVFDEAGSMLDPRGRRSLRKVMRKLHQEGLGIIHITHFMEEAFEAERVIVLDKGSIKFDGSPDEVFSHTQELLDMNLDLPFEMDLREKLSKAGIELSAELELREALVEYCSQKPPRTQPLQQPQCSQNTASLTGDAKRTESFKSFKSFKASGSAQVAEAQKADHILEAQHVWYSYQGQKGLKQGRCALKDISFTLKKGQFIGLMGHTGSGKSSLIEHLNGLKVPHSGEITVEGISSLSREGRRAIRKRVGYVGQYPEHQLFANTVFEDVAFGLQNLDYPADKIEPAVYKALSRLGLDPQEIKDKSPFRLSGGQKRRVALAGIIVMEPKILLLDEPLAGLDPKGRKDILKLISELNQEGCTIVMISHSMDDLAQLCDEIIVLNKGELFLKASPKEIFSQPEKLKEIGLDIPQISQLYLDLQDEGIDLGAFCYKQEQFIEAMRSYRQTKEGFKDGI